MTEHAADDDRIVLSPISSPDPADRARRRRRRNRLALACAALVVAGGISWWAVAANSGDSRPVKHTAVLPKTFGGSAGSAGSGTSGRYTEAKPGTSWAGRQAHNTDIAKGDVDLTYLASGGRAALIYMTLDPPDFTSDDGTHYGPGSTDMTDSLLGIDRPQKITSYPAGKLGGRIQCADPSAVGRTITRCAWQSKAATVALTPGLDQHTVVDHGAAAVLRAFLDALEIEPEPGG